MSVKALRGVQACVDDRELSLERPSEKSSHASSAAMCDLGVQPPSRTCMDARSVDDGLSDLRSDSLGVGARSATQPLQ